MNNKFNRVRDKILDIEDINLINNLIKTEGSRGRTYISKQLCRIWDWRSPNGIYRDMTCRQLLRSLDRKGLIKLPPPIKPGRIVGYKNKTVLPSSLNMNPIDRYLSTFSDINVEIVRGTNKENIYNGLIGAYHYLGYHQGVGEQLKYLVYGNGRLLSCIGFGSSAWKVACRDRYIGWDQFTREQRLFLIVNNHRFLILPWVKVPNLASHILGCISRRLRNDWQSYYNHDIVLIETFVEGDRFKGVSYRAANWHYLGQTTGRGRNDHTHRSIKPIKDVYVYPLTKDFRERLSQ